jgi:hypothetical protein
MGRCPVQPRTPLGPDQVNALLLAVAGELRPWNRSQLYRRAAVSRLIHSGDIDEVGRRIDGSWAIRGATLIKIIMLTGLGLLEQFRRRSI